MCNIEARSGPIYAIQGNIKPEDTGAIRLALIFVEMLVSHATAL